MALYFVFPLVGGVAAVVFVWLLGLRKFSAVGLAFGVLALVISVLIQRPVQSLPIIAALAPRLASVKSVEELQQLVREFIESIGLAGVAGLSLWSGFVAGAVQTAFKYLFISPVLKRSYRGALSVGLAFGFAEAVFVAVRPLLAAASIPEVPAWMIAASAAASAFERFSAALFHIGTSLYIADAARGGVALRGVLTVTAIHGFIDTAAILCQTAQMYRVLDVLTALVLGEVAVVAGLVIGLLLTLKLRGRVLEEVQT